MWEFCFMPFLPIDFILFLFVRYLKLYFQCSDAFFQESCLKRCICLSLARKSNARTIRPKIFMRWVSDACTAFVHRTISYKQSNAIQTNVQDITSILLHNHIPFRQTKKQYKITLLLCLLSAGFTTSEEKHYNYSGCFACGGFNARFLRASQDTTVW